MATTFPHMCRDGHVEIGHRDSESEQCPVCVLLTVVDDLAHASAAAADRMSQDGNKRSGTYLGGCVQVARSVASEIQR
jgi:xanthine/CO dehydrogenase XdhC/CoxF family maturation factor